ncbi:CAF17-like 4Fe-4S cluster assembly/insertion protein YgfZ [Govanella unica]|uniref:Folate-binding protein n=1 Tax=Govanella unica TaxID=2975056 RepID=A0A9X3TWA4_9PROT|nr:hypothetical protein [Govania unica]MDA5193160.1 folate-binding protein [Govania unica]
MTEAVLLASRTVFEITGEDRKNFLQGVITQDITSLTPGQAIYAALLTPQGKYLHDFLIIEDGERLLIDALAERLPDLLRRLTMYRLRSKAQLTPLSDSLAVAASFGETSWPASAVVYKDPRHPGLGERAILPRGDVATDLGDEATYDRERLRLGIPAPEDFEIDKTLILEGNLDALHGVSFTKGCYVGQELTTRTKHRGKVRRRLLPVKVSGPLPAPGTPITRDGKAIGQIRSGQGNRAMASLRVEDLTPGASYAAGDAEITPSWPDWLPRAEITGDDD